MRAAKDGSIHLVPDNVAGLATRDPAVHRIDGKHIVAIWLLSSSVVALVWLAIQIPDILARWSAWRAAVGPFVVALLGLVAGWRLLRHGDGVRLALIALTLPTVALSAGPFAYRLDVGPFVRLGITSLGPLASVGNDARLLLVLGSSNRVPSGIAVNMATLAALGVLLMSRHNTSDTALLGERRS